MSEEEKFWKALREAQKEREKERKERESEREKERKEWEKERKEREKEREKERREWEKERKELDKRIARVTDGWGLWVEGTVAPSAAKTFRKLGYKIIAEHHRIQVHKDGRGVGEYDTLLVGEKDGTNVLFVGEAKTKFVSEYVIEFLEDISKIGKYFKEYRGYDVIGFIAGVNYGEGVKKFAAKKGLYIFKPSGEIMTLDVPKGFKPRVLKCQ